MRHSTGPITRQLSAQKVRHASFSSRRSISGLPDGTEVGRLAAERERLVRAAGVTC